MNDKILNLDNKIKLKKTVENNIIYVIKNYAQNMDHIKSPFISYTKEYIMSILYNNVKILLIIEETCNPLTMDKEYIISTTNSENNNNTVYSNNNNYYGLPAIGISFLNNEFKKNEAYINTISKNKRHKVDSGTIAVNLSIRLCSYLNVNYVYIGDASYVKCEKNNKNDYITLYNFPDEKEKNRLSLKLLKLLTTGNTFYNRFGFTLDVKDYSKINKAIKKVQKIKMADILKINIKIRDIISKVIENGDIDKIKFLRQRQRFSNYMNSDIKFLNNYYLYLSQNIIILKKYIKKNDTIISYTKRISKDNCDIYIKTIQCLFIDDLFPFKSVFDLFIIFYEDSIIAYTNLNELYILKYLTEDTNIYYKKKI